MIKTLNKSYFYLPTSLFIIITVAFFLRFLWLPQNLFFGFEQGRDMLAVAKIINFEDFRLIGANTDIDGIFHGAFYYYFLTPFFLMTKGDPLKITGFLILLNVVGIYFLYKATGVLFNRQIAFLSSLFYAISYSAVIYARWLSNPNPIPFFSIFLFYCLVLGRSKKLFLYLAAFSWGIIFHLSLATASTLVLPILLFLILYKIKLSYKDVLIIFIVSIIVFSPYILFDFKNKHLLSKNLIHFAGNIGKEKNHLAAVELFFTEITDNLIPFNRTLSLSILVIVLLSVLSLFRKRGVQVILGFVLLPTFLYSIFGITPIRHIYIALPVFLSVLLAVALFNLWKKKYLFVGGGLIILVLFSNVWHLSKILPESKGNFLQRSQRTYLGDEKKVLDYIYYEAKGGSFSYEYFSVPWWKSEAWEYLFSWYGKGKYGYIPMKEKTQVFYSVWEPDETIPIYKDNWYGVLNTNSNIIEIRQFGSLGVEKREWKQKI